MKFREIAIAQFKRQGYTKSIYQNFGELLDAISCLLKICIELFITEVSKMKAPCDISTFVVQYDATNTNIQSKIALKQLCKSIFCIVPILRFHSDAPSVFHNSGEGYISELLECHRCVMELAQFYGILLTYQREIGKLIFDEGRWKFVFNDDLTANLNHRFQCAILGGALESYCEDDFVCESFIDTFRRVFKDVEGNLYERIFKGDFFYDCNNLTEQEFCKIISGESPQRGIIELTDIVVANQNNPCIRGLVFEEANSDLYMAITKPYQRKFRTRFRPFIQIFVDDIPRYITTQGIYYEAISELSSGHYAHNELPEEWTNIKELKKEAKSIFKRHSDLLEDTVASLLNDKYMYLKNVTHLSNVSCEKAPVLLEGQRIPNKKVGEIDFIIIDDVSKSIFVIDAKYLKPTFSYPSFANDASKFRKEGGYEDKLTYKINWVVQNIKLLCKQLKRKDITDYSVKGFFVTDNLVYYSLLSCYPIIPISNLLDYLYTSDRYCFLPNIQE